MTTSPKNVHEKLVNEASRKQPGGLPMAIKNSNGATLGFEETLWQAADKMRGHIGRAQ